MNQTSWEGVLREAEHGEVLAYRAHEKQVNEMIESSRRLTDALCADDVDEGKVADRAKALHRASTDLTFLRIQLTQAQEWHDRVRERHEAEGKPLAGTEETS